MNSHAISIQSTLQQRLDTRPDERALAYFDASRTCNWIELGALVASAAGPHDALLDAGLKPGDVTVIVMSQPDETSRVLLAVLLAGCVPVLVAPPLIQGSNSSLPAIIKDVVRKTRARVVVYANGGLAEQLHSSASARAVNFEQVSSDSSACLRFAERPPQSIAAMQLTSGTTGAPRICVWTHEKVQAALRGMAQAMDVGRNDTFLNWTPLYHDMGLINNFMLCLLHEIPLVLMSPFDLMKCPALWLQALSDTEATTSWSPNFGFALAAQRSTEQQLAGIRLDHVRGLWNAAERIHYNTLVEFQERFEPYGLSPSAIKTNFGCAENIGGATFSDPHGSYQVEMLDPVAVHELREAIPARPGQKALPVVGVGKGHPGITVHILDSDGRSLPEGMIGEVAMDTTSRMEGYLGEPEETSTVIVDGLLKTGDLGYLRGGELFWTGRTRECIACRGRKIDPSEFEAPLLKIPDLRPGCFVAFGVDDDASGTEKIVIVSEVNHESRRSLESVRKDVSEVVARQLGLMNLADFVMVRRGTLTKTSSGKRRHRHFKELYLRGELEQFQVGIKDEDSVEDLCRGS
jgi:acyl-CoA synthetase (AMP-forming)/AMP-acid ligase II